MAGIPGSKESNCSWLRWCEEQLKLEQLSREYTNVEGHSFTSERSKSSECGVNKKRERVVKKGREVLLAVVKEEEDAFE